MPKYINPQTPEGMVTWGSLVVLLIFYALMQTHGQLNEVWPHRCQLLKSQLQKDPIYQLAMVTVPDSNTSAHHIEQDEFSLSLSADQKLFIPALPYQAIEIIFQPKIMTSNPSVDWFTSYHVAIHFIVNHQTKITGYGKLDLPKANVQRVLHYMLGISNIKVSLPSFSNLIQQGLRQKPQYLTCKATQANKEISQLLGLTYKSILVQHHTPMQWGSGWKTQTTQNQKDYQVFHWSEQRASLPDWIDSKLIDQSQHTDWVWTWFIPTQLYTMTRMKHIPTWHHDVSNFIQKLDTASLEILRQRWSQKHMSKSNQDLPKLIIKE